MIDYYFTAQQAKLYTRSSKGTFMNESLLKEIELRVKLAAFRGESRILFDKKAEIVGTGFKEEELFLRQKGYNVWTQMEMRGEDEIMRFEISWKELA